MASSPGRANHHHHHPRTSNSNSRRGEPYRTNSGLSAFSIESQPRSDASSGNDSPSSAVMGSALFATTSGSRNDAFGDSTGLLMDNRRRSSSMTSAAYQADECHGVLRPSAPLVGDGLESGGGGGPPSPSRKGYSVDETIEYLGIGRFHVYAGIICGIANAADAVELLAIGYIIPKLDVHGEEKGIVSAAVFAGMLVGGMIAGVLSDKWGRKPLLIAALGVNATFGVLSAFAPGWSTLAACRVVSGVGVGGSIPSVFTLYAEYLPVHNRGRYLSFVAAFWMVGSIYTAGVAWILLGHYNYSWRVFALFAAVPAFTGFLLVLMFLPESPRHLAEVGRVGAARESMIRIARACRRSLAPVPDWYLVAPPPHQPEGRPVGPPSVWQPFFDMKLLFHRSLVRTTSMLTICWFTLSFGWYGLILWVPTLFKDSDVHLSVYQNTFLVAAANLPGNIFALIMMDKIGRKKLLSLSMFVSAGLAVLFAFSRNAVLIVSVASALNAVSIGGWNALDCLSTESFPTSLRTSGMGFLSGWGRLGSMAGQLVFGWLIDVSFIALLVTAAVLLLFGAVAGALLPHEPSGTQLSARIEDLEPVAQGDLVSVEPAADAPFSPVFSPADPSP